MKLRENLSVQQYSRYSLLLAMVLSIGSAAAQQQALNPCIAGQSCFTDVTDILNGQRHLLRVDDLVVAGQFGSTFAGAILNTANSTITAARASSLAGLANGCPGALPALASARMFNLNHDVTLSASGSCSSGITVVFQLSAYVDPDADLPKPYTMQTSFGDASAPGFPFRILSVVADFTGDGYDDVAFVGLAFNFGGEQHQVPDAIVVSAVDPNTPGSGLRNGGPTGFNFASVIPLAATAGDFAGNGAQQLAILGISSETGGPPGGLGLQFYSVDPSSLKILIGSQVTLTIPEGSSAIAASASIVAGRFGNTTHDQLALAYVVLGGTVKIITLDFDAEGNPIQTATVDTHILLPGATPSVIMKAGHFDWSGAFDQAALLVSDGDIGGSEVMVLTFDSALNPAPGPSAGTSGACQFDMAAGSFDRTQPNPGTPPPATVRNPNLQLAVLASDCGSNASVSIYDVDPANRFAISAGTTFPLPAQLAPGPLLQGVLAASDTQGRSLALGAPAKVVVAHRSQPSVVLAAPPMHVDFIAPARVQVPQVFNVSAIPDGYFSQYQTDQSNSNQSSTQSTTSWSAGTSESLSGKAVFGIPGLDSVTVQNKFSAQQAWKGNAEKVHGTTQSTAFDVSQQTGFGDQLWYKESRLNLYIYPVIGQTGCPAAIPNCAESQKVPLTVQLSGVDAVSNETVPGNTTEWYQPPWEPGNVLSYPGNFAQLQAIAPDIDQVSTDFTWVTDQSVFLEKTTWNTNSNDSQSTSFDQNYSFNDTLSTSGTTDEVIVQASFKASLSLSGSVGFSNLHTSVTTLGKSTGIAVQKPGSFASPTDYQYFVTPYIFGQKRPGGVVNDIPLSTDVQTFGILQTAFVVDPIRADAGGWWRQAYSVAPDVALNHPTRWNVRLSDQANPNDGTCLLINASSSDIDCATPSPADPTNPWLSEFHSMRGFFITGAEAGGMGPQLETATAGDQLLLQARVYNYSLAPMPAGTTVHTRFYGVPWNNNNNTAKGPSFLIGEAITGTIPPFNTDSANLNWQLVSIPQPFDTTPYPDQYLTFWVVVWMEDSSGRLVGELPGHGLQTIPGPLTNFGDVAAFEQTFSNNVGFYKSAFYVFPAQSPPTPVVTPSGPAFKMAVPTLSTQHIRRGQAVKVYTFVAVGGTAIDGGTTLLFYDGDPAAGGKVFDAERIVYMRARDYYAATVFFRSNTCGAHRLFAVAAKGTAFATTRQSLPLTVDCP